MAWYLGLFGDPQRGYVSIPDYVYRELKYMGTVPPDPLIPASDYQKIIDYYTRSAPPTTPSAQASRFAPGQMLQQFSVEKGRPEFPLPGVTLVTITQGGFFIANASDSSFSHKNATGSTISRTALGGYPVHLIRGKDELLVTTMGSFTPLDDSTGSVVALKQKGNTFQQRKVISGLKRPVHSQRADLDGDGRQDVVVCEFGSNLGGFSWFRNQGNDTYRKHIINALPGAIRTEIGDFDRNGWPDIAVLMGQAREGIFLYSNQGHGIFSEKTLLAFPPTYGSSDFQMPDMNGDGNPDIVYANGDHADYPENPPRLRPYHGIRIFLSKGNDRYEESFFFPMNGVYRFVTADFDGDGDTDLAAVAHFADYYRQPLEGFVYLENQGNGKFTPRYLAESQNGRWLTLDSGDMDGDGDIDLILGAALSGIDTAPRSVQTHWEAQNLSYLILRNRQKQGQ
jgi:hypothetical protein